MGKRTRWVDAGARAPTGASLGVAATILLFAATGCVPLMAVGPPPPLPRLLARPAPAPVSPFADSPISFTVRGAFARGEQVIVRVCLNPDRSIASASILESSGDRHFDELAVDWARRVRLRPLDGSPVAACGAVRVELHDSGVPAVMRGVDNVLG